MYRPQLIAAENAKPVFRVIDHPSRSVRMNVNEAHVEGEVHADIRIVGVGSIGSRAVKILSRNLPGVRYHEILRNHDGGHIGDMSSLLSSVVASDLVFVISAFEDESCAATAQVIGAAAVGAGVPILLVTDGKMQDTSFLSRDVPKWFDTVFRVSRDSLPDQDGSVPLSPASLIGFGMRHVVGVITTLITYQTGICIDFADVKAIMRGGDLGRMGIGIGADDSRGATAAKRAIDRLTSQGVDVSSASGVLAAVHGSGDITMDDFDTASKVIFEHASADANVLVGLITDERLGGKVKVSMLTVH